MGLFTGFYERPSLREFRGNRMNLPDTLHAIAAQLNLNAAQLIEYAAEDTIGGFDFDESKRKWDVGSIWEVEGQVLYTLIRVLQPQMIAEFGVNKGCSSTHFLAALEANKRGALRSVDPWQGAGSDVPQELRERWSMIFHTGIEWLELQPDAAFDILFEDMGHGAVGTRDWWLVAQRKIKPGGIIISHDAAHAGVGADVMRGIVEAGVHDARVYLSEPSDCRLAVWQAPGVVEQLKPEVMVGESIETTPELLRMAADRLSEIANEVEAQAIDNLSIEAEIIEVIPVYEEGWPHEEMRIGLGDDHPIPIEFIDDLDAEVHAPVEIEELPEPLPKKRGRKPKAAK